MARKEATNYGHMIKLVNQYDAAKGYLDACNHNATNTGGLASRPRQTRTSSGTWQYNAQGLGRNFLIPRALARFGPLASVDTFRTSSLQCRMSRKLPCPQLCAPWSGGATTTRARCASKSCACPSPRPTRC